MDYSFSTEFWSAVIPIALLAGAAGGLIWDIGNAVHRSRSNPQTGFDNLLSLPQRQKSGEKVVAIELGFFGPMLAGAIAGVLLVLLVAPTGPSTEDAAKAVVAVSSTAPQGAGNGDAVEPSAGSQGTANGKAGGGTENPGNGGSLEADEPSGEAINPTPAQATQVAEDNLGETISSSQLVLFALLGGLGGWALLQSLTTRLSDLLEGALGKAIQPAKQAGGEEVRQQLKELSSTVPDEQVNEIVEKVEEAVGGAAVAAASKPPVDPT
jgi:hypothetical protein